MEKEYTIKIMLAMLICVICLSLIILFIFNLQSGIMPVPEERTVFVYPFDEPEFMQYGNIIVSYEYIDDKRHLIAVNNNGSQYVMPLFKTREEALDFMNQYFEYLKGGD